MKTILLALILVFKITPIFAAEEALKSVYHPSTEIEATTASDTDVVKNNSEEIKAVKAPAETEIPLNLEAPKKAAASEGIMGKVIYSIAILTLLAGGIFYFLRKYSMPKNSKMPTQIKVLSQHHFGPKRSLALVRVAGESILIGITDQNINLIKSLSLLDEDIPEEMPKSFSKTLKDQSEDEVTVASTSQEEDFAISGIKDIVHRRLKSMRNFQ